MNDADACQCQQRRPSSWSGRKKSQIRPLSPRFEGIVETISSSTYRGPAWPLPHRCRYRNSCEHWWAAPAIHMSTTAPLERWTNHCDAYAFNVLIARHGNMVPSPGRRHSQDAETSSGDIPGTGSQGQLLPMPANFDCRMATRPPIIWLTGTWQAKLLSHSMSPLALLRAQLSTTSACAKPRASSRRTPQLPVPIVKLFSSAY